MGPRLSQPVLSGGFTYARRMQLLVPALAGCVHNMLGSAAVNGNTIQITPQRNLTMVLTAASSISSLLAEAGHS